MQEFRNREIARLERSGWATNAALREVLDAVGLRDWVDAAPDGLDTILDSGADSLSGGQRRRLILTRALVSTAPILLLDEPTEHLDEESNHILEILRNTTDLPGGRGRRTVIVVRHPRTQR